MSIKGKKDILDHVAGSTGIARADVGKVVDAAFGYLRETALAGTDVAHPSLGRIRVKTRDAEGAEGKTVYRYMPDAEIKVKRGKRGKAAPDTD